VEDSRDGMPEEESEINLTPMLDVVFIMLIFFIVTAVFVKTPGVEVERPEALNWEPSSAGAIYIAVTPQDEIWIDNEMVDATDARYSIERLHKETPEAALVIQADANARNEVVIRVMDAGKAAGVQEIIISAGEF